MATRVNVRTHLDTSQRASQRAIQQRGSSHPYALVTRSAACSGYVCEIIDDNGDENDGKHIARVQCFAICRIHARSNWSCRVSCDYWAAARRAHQSTRQSNQLPPIHQMCFARAMLILYWPRSVKCLFYNGIL